MPRPYLIRLLVWAVIVVAAMALVIQWVARDSAGAPPAPKSPMAMPAGELATTDALVYLSRAANVWLSRAGDNWLFVAQIALMLLLGWGLFGRGLGAYDLIYAESRAVRFGSGVLIGLMFGEILLVQHLTAGPAFPGVTAESPGLFAVGGDSARAAGLRRLGHYLLVAWPALLALFYLPAARRGSTPALGGGLLLAPLLVAAAVSAAWAFGSAGWGDWLARTPGARAGVITADDIPQHLIGLASLVAPLIILGAFGTLTFAGRVASPVWVIATLIWLFNAVYGLILYQFAGLQYVLALLAAFLAYVANARHSYKLCLPNMAPETAAARNRIGVASLGEAAAAPAPMLRPPEQFLADFAANHRRRTGSRAKPKLILVAASGGGVRAAVWTAAVLEGLETRLGPRFAHAVGIVGGASGGMVGAGLYAANKLTPAAGPSLAHLLARDSLWRLMQTYLIRDLPSLFLPFHRDWDRGFALESTWHANAPAAQPGRASPWRHSFADLARAERAGLAPALVFSPLLVEDGRRLLISNLDLSDLTAESVPTLGGPAARERLSVSGVEFFRLFPDAHDRFEVGTAARLNATFPFVSPSVCLPASPPRRVVDAGYFDNYGVNLLAGFLHKNRAAVREHTGGVCLLELRAFPMEVEKNGFDGVAADSPPPRRDLRARLTSTVRTLTATATLRVSPPRPSEGAEAGGAFLSALAGVSTPAEALLAVRSAGAYFRNDQLLGILDAEFNSGGEPFFVRAALDCPGEAALSWAISRANRDAILGHVASIDGADTAGLRATVAGLARWLGTSHHQGPGA